MLKKLLIALLLTTAGLSAGEDTIKPMAVFVHPDAAGKLPLIGSVAVILDGVDRAVVQMVEDALTLNLLAESIKVAYPSEKELGQERPEIPVPYEWAKKQGANCLITGTVVARCARCAHGKSGCTSKGIRAISISLVDIPQEKVLLWALYEPQSEVSPTLLAREFVRLLRESLQPKEKKGKE